MEESETIKTQMNQTQSKAFEETKIMTAENGRKIYAPTHVCNNPVIMDMIA